METRTLRVLHASDRHNSGLNMVSYSNLSRKASDTLPQHQTDNAPSFPDVMESMAEFLVTHRILDGLDRRPLVRFCWCSDGPWDICDFVIKQCFISKVNWTLAVIVLIPTFHCVLGR